MNRSSNRVSDYEKVLGWSERLAFIERFLRVDVGSTLELESHQAAGIASILGEISKELPDIAEKLEETRGVK